MPKRVVVMSEFDHGYVCYNTVGLTKYDCLMQAVRVNNLDLAMVEIDQGVTLFEYYAERYYHPDIYAMQGKERNELLARFVIEHLNDQPCIFPLLPFGWDDYEIEGT